MTEYAEDLLETAEGMVGALREVASAIRPLDASAGKDEAGGVITSLTEAAMGHTAGLYRLAESMDRMIDGPLGELTRVADGLFAIAEAIEKCAYSPLGHGHLTVENKP